MELKFNSIEEVRQFVDELDPAKDSMTTVSRQLAKSLADVISYQQAYNRIGKIAAIKIHRAVTGVSLKESKEMIERYYGGR